jgi:hypothetical protein
MALPLVTNIGSRGRRRRYLMGVAGVAVTILAAAVFAYFGIARGARLVLFLPLFMGALGFLQGHGGT